jgi:transcriptional regulator GlxA family with amidase domain
MGGREVVEMTKTAGFRLGIYVFKDAEIVDFAAPYGVFSVARRFDAELDAFLIADAMRPVQAQAGFTVLPNYSLADEPAMDAFLDPWRVRHEAGASQQAPA